MRVARTNLSDLLRIEATRSADGRGTFTKIYHHQLFADLGVKFDVAEAFVTTSRKGVVRGMHFQAPPAAHTKLVYCSAGAIIDVVLDLRRGRETFGCYHECTLSQDTAAMLIIPAGFAHGFLVVSNEATVTYLTDHVHSPAADTGVLWDSFGFKWPVETPVLSQRDQQFPRFTEFVTPFA